MTEKKRNPFTITDSMEIVMLRVSIGEVAQALHVETPELPVMGKTLEQLAIMAKHNERGWNTLANKVKERLQTLLN